MVVLLLLAMCKTVISNRQRKHKSRKWKKRGMRRRKVGKYIEMLVNYDCYKREKLL